jgi:hypothetical protein
VIIIKLQGGLGNQMFQYAAAKGLLKDKEKVYLDHHFLEDNHCDTEHFTARDYELGIFKNVKARRAENWQIKLFKGQSVYLKLLRSLFKTSVECVQQPGSSYLSLSITTRKANLYLDGYFQSESYFKQQRADILKVFEFPALDNVNDEVKKKINASANSVSIHVRRGDYLKSEAVSKVHGVLPLSYYQKGLSILKEKFPSMTLFVFSDDIFWVKTNFQNVSAEVYMIENNSAKDSWKDMALMSHCNHHIIANSSFSWWGAWLNPRPDKIVIAPDAWFADPELNLQSKSIIPEHWIRI